MQMMQCPNGHFYDSSKYGECPYCTSNTGNACMNLDYTRPANLVPENDMEHTQAIFKKEIGLDPVVGWLVSINGSEKGKDHRIHADNNFIGRSEKMDVILRGDDTISRENHAIVSYDTRDDKYYFSQAEGRSIVRVNGKAIFSTVELKRYDEIEIGNTKLLFIPLCGEEFKWKES